MSRTHRGFHFGGKRDDDGRIYQAHHGGAQPGQDGEREAGEQCAVRGGGDCLAMACRDAEAVEDGVEADGSACSDW